MALQASFDKAAEDVKKLKETPSNDDLLEIYAFFKQGTVGDCETAKPGMFDFKGKAKWESWNGKKGTTKEEAMDLYIKKVQGLIESVGLAE